jgi:hypothetical protein
MGPYTLARERERLYRALAGKPAIVHVPEMSFVMIDGQGIRTRRGTTRTPSRHSMRSPTRSSSPSRRKRESSIGWAASRVCGGPRT